MVTAVPGPADPKSLPLNATWRNTAASLCTNPQTIFRKDCLIKPFKCLYPVGAGGERHQGQACAVSLRSAPVTKDIPRARGSRAAGPCWTLWAQASLSSGESPALVGSPGRPARRRQQRTPAFSASDLSRVWQNGPRSGVQQPSEGMAEVGSSEAAEDAKATPSPAAPELSSGGAGQPSTTEGRRAGHPETVTCRLDPAPRHRMTATGPVPLRAAGSPCTCKRSLCLATLHGKECVGTRV